MGQISFNVSKGKLQWYYEQARDTAADIGAMLIVAAGNPADSVMKDYDHVAAILAGSADEATFTNYNRKLLPLGTTPIGRDNALDRVTLSVASPITWSQAGGSGAGIINNQMSRIVLYYNPAPGTAPDNALVPLSAQDINAITDGSGLVITMHADGVAIVRDP